MMDGMKPPEVESVDSKGVIEVFLVIEDFAPDEWSKNHFRVAESQTFVIPSAIFVNYFFAEVNHIVQRSVVSVPIKINNGCFSFFVETLHNRVNLKFAPALDEVKIYISFEFFPHCMFEAEKSKIL